MSFSEPRPAVLALLAVLGLTAWWASRAALRTVDQAEAVSDYTPYPVSDSSNQGSAGTGAGATPADPDSIIPGFIQSSVRGVRNNNPGNIRKSREKWQGLAEDQTDPAFFRFASMAWGVRAIVVILRTYRDRYGLRTPAQLIGRWAPPSENDTAGYSQAVADAVGVGPGDPVDLADPEQLRAVVRAIIRMENGRIGAALVTDAAIEEGIARAG